MVWRRPQTYKSDSHTLWWCIQSNAFCSGMWGRRRDLRAVHLLLSIRPHTSPNQILQAPISLPPSWLTIPVAAACLSAPRL